MYLFLALLLCVEPVGRAASPYFQIKVVDEATGRGIPLVEVSTVNALRHWTDSAGLVAFLEPGLMERDVFFSFRSHGYEYPKDGFGNRGLKLHPQAGKKAVIKMKRLNVAQRLYRNTGEGIYNDSILLGEPVPTKLPVINGLVLGQDTVIVTPYRGKLYWFWGDTDRAAYPLGNFGASGATSMLPEAGGLNPDKGVDFTYFVGSDGFSKPMCPKLEPGLQWIESVFTVKDTSGRERLLARVASGAGLGPSKAWHLAAFNDEKQVFESVMRWDIHDGHDSSHPFRAMVGSQEYLYLYPEYRVKADWRSVTNLASYEAYTCVLEETADPKQPKIARAADGLVEFKWRPGARRLGPGRMRELVKEGLLKPEESWARFKDVETGKEIRLDRGSVCWNEYRKRWIMIGWGGVGETWFTEAETPLGPWADARKIVSHDNYNFYNPTQHPYFDQEGGRIIYFEATYTAAFSGAKEKTPRYDYNQIMYKLDLRDPRLALPPQATNLRPAGDAVVKPIPLEVR